MTTIDAVPVIRAAELDDLDLVVIRRLDFLAEHRGLDRDRLDPEFVEVARAFLQRTHCRTFLSWFADIDDTCVGIISVIISDAPPRPEDMRSTDGYIVNMYVDPAHRSKGIGRLLVDRAMADGEAAGVRRFSLYATDDGRPLYESVGFVDEPGWMNRYT